MILLEDEDDEDNHQLIDHRLLPRSFKRKFDHARAEECIYYDGSLQILDLREWIQKHI